MPNRVIEDQDQFRAFLAAQPLCQWAAQKQQEMDMGNPGKGERSSIHPPAPPKDDNADLAAALASMA